MPEGEYGINFSSLIKDVSRILHGNKKMRTRAGSELPVRVDNRPRFAVMWSVSHFVGGVRVV